ncbi:hypothetical protein ABT084_00750 [Streptomyces sp. NPDC002138]|uniref:hypothetical protein n=1 Tax=Streptomyces sp. NPDC002138 TaxID=3154410 RepID=UPI00331EB903
MADVDAITWELYGLRPDEFTAARDASAARAREAGESAAAKRIKALRKPTLAVWAANLLARSDPDQAQRLLDLGQALREAHRSLAGGQLRELSHQQHVVIAAMARRAKQLAEEAGLSVSEGVQQDVERILHTVLADRDTAEMWLHGVLAKAPPLAVGFTALEPPPGAGPPPERPPAASSPAAPATAPATQAGGASGAAPARIDVKALERARAQADRTSRAAAEAEDGLARAERELARGRSGLDALDERIAGLREQLDSAREERARLSAAADALGRRHRQAAQTAKTASTAARKAQAVLAALRKPCS